MKSYEYDDKKWNILKRRWKAQKLVKKRVRIATLFDEDLS